jgi:succinoglycan biosynthesis protein ExoM
MIHKLLGSLQNQITENLFTYSAVVVDNDSSQSAHDTVTDWKQKSVIEIDYFCEPIQNIALARNKAVANGKGNFIAFIDDDEFPESTWLINLLKTQKQYKAAGVLGPVKPHFEIEPPQWIIRGRICERSSFSSGTILKKPSDTRTGNVLLNKELFSDQEKFFNPKFGRTGGEDVDFFHRMMNKGFSFVWCNEASVYEVVPPERFRKKYYIKKALLRGKVNADKSSIFSLYTFKSIIASFLYTAALPFLALLGQHLFMKYLIKDCDHIGKILGLLGFKIVVER